MIIAIIGSRTFNTYNNLLNMDLFINDKVDATTIGGVVSGGANGADTLGRIWAEANSIPIKEFIPDWKMYGGRAGILRNHSIIDAADVVFAFWDGKSNGTRHSIKIAKEKGKQIHIYSFPA